jgi:hypothetical protein
MDPKRRGVYGNLFNMAGIKRASLSFFEGVTDVHGRTVIEAIQGHQGGEWSNDNPFKKGSIKEDEHLQFKSDTAQRFAAMHVFNAFQIYNFLINSTEFNIENMVTYDNVGRIIVDQEKANKMIDGIQKSIRYAYCTWTGVDYNKTIRVMEGGKDGEVKEMPILAAMFGPDILKLIQKDIDRRNIKSEKPNVWKVGGEGEEFDLDFSKAQSKDEREMLWKHILDFLIAKEIHSHRSMKSQLRRYDYAATERIYRFLRAKGLIVDEEEIAEMRKMSNSTRRILFAEDFVLDGGKGALEGFWKMFKIIAKDLSSGK